MLSSGANVIIWDEVLSSRTKCYHLGWNVIILNAMLSCGANVIIWDKMLSCGGNVVMLSYGANVIIWCYHVMLSSGMITPPFFYFSWKLHSLHSGPHWNQGNCDRLSGSASQGGLQEVFNNNKKVSTASQHFFVQYFTHSRSLKCKKLLRLSVDRNVICFKGIDQWEKWWVKYGINA